MFLMQPAMDHCLQTGVVLVNAKRTVEGHEVQLIVRSKIGNGAKFHFSKCARELYG